MEVTVATNRGLPRGLFDGDEWVEVDVSCSYGGSRCDVDIRASLEERDERLLFARIVSEM